MLHVLEIVRIGFDTMFSLTHWLENGRNTHSDLQNLEVYAWTRLTFPMEIPFLSNELVMLSQMRQSSTRAQTKPAYR